VTPPRSPSKSPPGTVSPARWCAYQVVRRVFEHGAYADRAFTAEAAGLDARDRALAMALAYGTVQRRATLDHVISRLSRRPPDRLDPPVLAALRLGLLQLLLLDGIAEHAAVNESVELVKRSGHGGQGLVNAVLRRAVREGQTILSELDDRTPASAAVLHSVPVWLAELWFAELGAEVARAMLARINQPAESAVRVNTLVASVAGVLARVGVAGHPAPGLPEGLVLDAPFDVHGSPLWGKGAIMPQSRGSMLVARALDPQPGQRVLDLCAAPGAKTTQLAALMGDRGRLVAVERHPGRAQALQRTLARMQISCAEVRIADATLLGDIVPSLGNGSAVGDSAESPGDTAGFDRVLVDPPCSGLGTLQSRPDLRWRTSPERIADLAPLQAAILRAGAAATAAGGALVYSVCTISKAEGERVIDGFLTADERFACEDVGPRLGIAGPGPCLQLRPDEHGTDGFFIARLRRR
jgi:16S rRNA (cytosine967-C5)-methyltransferase